jgi:cytochrome-b5 reductase
VTKQVATKVLTSPYLFVGLVAWTGFAAYYLFPQKEQDFILPTKDSVPFPPSQFRPAVLVSSEITSKDTRLLTLGLPPRLLSPKADIPAIWSIYVKDDDIYIERPYTPLEGVDDKRQIKLWVKMYPDGEVGKWLHSKKPGNAIEIRGPVQTHLWKNDGWDEVIMVCTLSMC